MTLRTGSYGWAFERLETEGKYMSRLASRLVGTATALLVTASLGIAVASGPASAATGAQCAGFKGTVKGVGTLTKCTNPAATGGKGNAVMNLAKSTGKITWNKTGTTAWKFTYKAPKAAKGCAAGTSQFDISGTVTGGTGAAVKSLPKGHKISASLCVGKTGITLKPGTVFKF
jgi:hypothetical protein